MRTQSARFQEKVAVRGDGCWGWVGTIHKHGYGRFYDHGNHAVPAHRWAYEAWIGPIPPGAQIDHMCHNPHTCSGGYSCPHRSCVNPLHMQLADAEQNLARRSSVVVTECPQGHRYDDVNTYTTSAGTRMCRECNRTRAREYQRRKRASGRGA